MGIPVVKIGNVKNGTLVMDNCSFVSRTMAASAGDFSLKNGDIVISMTGHIGNVAMARDRDLPLVVNQRVGLFSIPDPTRIDTRFLFYSLRYKKVHERIKGLGYGSVQPNVSPSLIHGVDIPLPPVTDQRSIAHVLGTLDDKIELNRQMNETLEEMARALFKSWFVDFDPVRAKLEGRDTGLPQDIAELFPDRLVDSELGEVPEGWQATTLGTVIELHDRKRIPLNKRQRSQRPGPYPYYGAAGIMDYVDDYLFDGVHVLTGEDGSVVDANGYPIVQYVWGRFWVNNHAHVIKGTGVLSDEHLYLLLKQTNITAFVTGAVQPKLNQKNLKAVPLVIPAGYPSRVFSDLVAPLFAKLRNNADECLVLSALRDTLLPKLISGKLRVKDAVKFIQSTV